MARACTTFSACLGLLLFALPAAAEGPSKKALATDKAAAQALFDEAVRLMNRENFGEACPKLEASQDLDPGIGTLLYLGDCYEHLGRRASAWGTFRDAESLARSNGQTARAELAATRAKALDKQLSHLTVSVPVHARVEGLLVRLGDRTISSAVFEQPFPIDPGQQILEVTAPGHQAYYRTLIVTDDGPHDYRLVVPTLLPAPTDDRGTTMRTLGVVTGAVGIAAVGTGAVFGILAAEKNADAVRYCPEDPKGCSERGVELQDDAESFTTVAKGSLAAGGGLILTGIVLYVAAPSDTEKERAAELKRVKLSPLLGSRWGASVNASF
jgi:serine/threonine-protein kinase